MHLDCVSSSGADLCPSSLSLALLRQGYRGLLPLSRRVGDPPVWHPLLMWALLRHLVGRLCQALLRAQLMAGLLSLPPRSEHLQLGALMRLEVLLVWSCLLPLSWPSPLLISLL